MELAFLFILALVAGSQAGPIQDRTDQCAQQCTVSRQFNYEEGKVYNYLYENSIRTQIQGASEDHAGLELKANVALKFASKCEAVMQLSDVRLSEHDPITSTLKTVSSDLGDRLAKYPIRVSFQDGKIEHVCLTDSSETPEIVNIKKGILSVIQNSMDDISKPQTVPETDVAGDCEAEYTSADKGWYNVKVTKSKNLLGCTGRHSALSSIQGIPYGSQSKVQSMPLVKSTYDCEQELVKSNGRLVSAMCEETHVFAPFSRHESGAVTNSRQTLTFRNEGKTRVDLAPVHMRVPLKFDHDDSNAMSTSVVELQQKLQEVCEGTKNGITRETPGLFKSIVYIMKTMDSPAMVDIFQKVKKPEFCPNNSERVKKFFMDAIPMTGTPAGVKLLTQMIIGKEVSGIEADMWLTSLSFIQNPTVDMLAEVKPLLSMNTHVEKAMLSVSSLVNSLCKTNPSCDNYLDVKKIISLLESKIENGCIVKESEMKTTLIALRAIGNAGFGTTAIPTIVKCFSRSENPIEIRLSAIESFRRMPCKVDRSPLLAILNNQEEDSEVRIAAYKSLMACPSDAILSHVKTVLSKEEVNQVGSYIWSHLTNLMESADPHKQAIRAILDDSILKKEFDMDKRKYSRNYEGSLFLEKINTGATVDADMIWSSKSFIPRSGMLNLTLDLFGSAVNLFEVGGRVEGLEYFLESYLGPNGYFSENDAQNAADETAVTAVRADKVNRITGRMSKVMDELRGNLYLRVFGNELRYMNFKGIDSLMSSEAMSVFDLLMKMSKDNKYQFSHSTMFMDSRFTIPTSSGFPLSLSVNGTATIDLQASGKLDVLKLASNPASLDINGIIKPSGAIQIASLMTINAASSKIGVKMISTLHTSTSLEGKVTLAEGSILDAEIGLPEKQMDIFSMESSFFTIHRELEREQEMITSNRQAQKVCTGDSLAKVAGIELCGELQYPNASLVADAPYFPITGPVKLGLVLNKKDTLTGYRLRARSTHTNEENIIHLSFSTPNSNIDRSFGIDFNLNKKAGTVDSSITSPWTSGNFKGVLNNDNNLKGVTGALNWDGKLRYEVKAMVSSEKSGPGMLYTPSLSIKIPGQKPVELKGTIKYAAWKILDIDMEFAGMTSSPVLVKTSVQNKGQMMRASASIQLEPKKEYIFDTSMQTIELKKKVSYRPQISLRTPKDEIFAFGGSFDQIIGRGYQYKFVLDKVASQPLVLKGMVVQREFRRGRVLFNVKVDLRTPLVETQMRTKLDNRNFKTIASDIDLKYVIKKYARDNVKLVTKISNLSSKSLTKLKGAALLTSKKYPEACFKFSGNLNHNNKHSDVDVDLTYGSDPKDLSKQMTVKASVDRQINKNWSQATLGLMGEYTFGNDLRLFSKVKHSHDDKSIESSVVFRKNKDAITADLVVKDESKELKKMSAKLDLYLTGKSLSLSHSIEETKYQDFTSTLLTQFGKSKSSVITAWKYSNDGTATLRSDVNIDGFEPLVVETDYKVSPGDYKATGSIQKGKNRYSLAASSLMNLDLVQVNVDILCPSRHIITHTEGSLSGGKYNIRADTRWNADRDDTQRVTVRGSGHISGFEQIDGSFTIQYPSRTIALNLKQSTVGKYISHVDFQWEPKKQMSIDTAFGSYDKGGKRELQGSVTMQTPFESLSKLDVKVNHVIDQSQYKTNVDVEWNPKQIMSATVTLKKPIDLTSIDFEIVGKTPFSEMKNFKVSHTQKKKDAFNSATKVEWNKQSVQMDTTLANNGNARKTELLAEVDIKTSFRTLKTISLHASYLLNEKRMQSRATLKANKNDYIIETLVNHEGFDLNKNSGEITITIPSNNIKASWNHNLNDKDVTTSSEITWANDRKISINFNGLKDLSSLKTLLTSAIQIQTPFANFKDITFQVKHQSRSGFVDSIMSLVNEGTTIAAAEGKYIRQNGNVNSYFTITNPFRDGDISIKVNSNLEMPLSLDIDISVTPLYSVSLKSSVNRNENGNVYSTIVLQSPQIEPVTITMTREVNRDGISLVLSLAYSGGKVIKINSIYNLGDAKFIKMSFASPFTSVYTSEVSMTTTPAAISVQGNIEALPYIPKWSAEAGLDRSNGISGNIRINTPISAAPYSQFSFSSGSDLRRNQINVNAEYLPGKVINVLVRYNIIDLQSVSFLSTLSTPLSSLQFSSLAINHQGPITDMRTTANIEYSKGQNIILEHTFSTRTGFKGSLGIKTPFSRDLKTSFDFLKQDKELRAVAEVVFGKRLFAQLVHSGSSDQFTSDLTFEMDNDKWNGNLAFEALPVLKTTLSLQTPLKKLGSITAMHSLEGNLMKFNNKLDLTSSEYGLFSVHADFDATDKISGSASIATPIRGYKKISGLFMHDGTFDRFQTRAEASLGTSKIAGDIKLVTKPSVNLDIEVETPIAEYKLLSLSLKHMGDSKSFKTNLKAQKNKLSSEILFNYNNEKKIDMDLTIRHLNYDPVKATFDLSGSWKRFSKKMQVSVGKEKYISDVRFQVKPFSTYVDVRSPLKWLKRHRLTMKHTGSINSFKCNLNYNCNGKKYNGDVSFSNANTIKGDFSFDGPSIPKITARVGHEGSLTKFTSEIEMSYGKRKMAINGDLNFEGGLRGRFDASTPFANMEMIRSSLSHTGSLANFKTEGVFSVNKQEGRLSLALATDNGINANVELFTPFRGLDRLFATFTHSGDFRHFNTESTVGMNEKSISGKVNFDNSATVTGDVSLTSSISDIGSYEGSFRHEGDSNKFISHAEVSVNSKRADLDINFDSTIGYTGFVSFKSPVGGLGQIDGSFRHNGNSKKFNTHAEMNFNGQRNEFDTMFDGTDGFEGFASLKSPITRNPEIGFKYASDPNSVKTNMYAGIDGGKQYNFVVDGSKAPEMKLVISIKTPIRGFEYSELSMNQRGNRNNFHTASILNFQGKTHEVELSLRNTPDIEGKLQIRSPAFKNFETSLAAVGSLNNFQSSFETRVDSRSIIRTDLMLNTDKNFETELKIMSPYFKNLMVSASNMRTSYGINAQALISLGSDRASGNLVLTLKPLISGSLDISTPFTKDVSIQVNHEGQLTNFKSDLDISYGGASQLNIQSSLIAERNINGNFKLESTIPGLKNIGADITHTQDASGINSYVEIRCNGDKTSSKVMYKPDEASIDLKSPFTKDITLKYGLKGSFPKVSATAEASIGSSSIIQIDAKMRTLTDGEISIRTPLKGYEQTGIKLRHMQSEKAFETHGEILVFGQTHTVDLAVSYTSAELKLQTPYMEPITITTRRSGTLTNFETHGEYVYGKSKYEVSLDLNVDTSKEGKLTMSLPQNDAEFSFNILGNRNQFTGVAKIDLNGRFHSIDVTYDSVEKLVISASIKSPLVPSVDAIISLNGDITDFTSKAELAVDNDRHNIEASLRSKDNIEAMFTLSSPLTAPLRMELQYNGELLKFESFASFSIDSAVYRSDISLDLKSNIKAQVSVISPKSAPLKVSLSSSKMDAVVSVNYGKSVFYTLNAGLQHDPLSGAVSFDSSLPGYEHIAARFSHEEKNLDFNTHAEVEYGQDKSEADFHFNVGSKLEGSISLRSPYMRTVSSGFNFNGNADRFASHIEASYGSDKYALDASIDTTSKLEGAIILSTPIQGYKNVEAKMSSAGALPNFDSTLSIKTGRRTLFTTGAKLSTDNGVSAKWIMSSVLTPTLQLDAEYKGVLTDFVSKLGLKYNGESANINVIFKGLPEPAFTLNLETSLSDPISTTMSLKRQSKAITVHAEGVIGSKTYETDLSVFYGNGITSSLSLKSPVQGLENIKISAKYSAENQAIKNSISIERNMAEFFYFGGEASWSGRIFGNMKLRTPFSGIEQLSAGGSVEGKIPNVKVDVRFANGKNEFSTVAELNHLTSTNGLIIISTPFAGYERLGGSFTKKGDLSDIDFQANVNYATGKDISVQLKNKIDRSSIETEAILQSPYTEDASFRLSFKGNPNAFTNTLSLGMGNENSLSSVTSFELTRSTMSFDSRLSSVLTGYRDEQRAKLLFKGDLLNYEASGSARLFGMDFSADSSLVVSPAFKGQINIRSPFAPLKDVGLSAELIKDGSKYTSSAEIKIDTGKKVKASAEVLKYGWRRLQSAMELNTPFSGWEQFKASYRHTASVDSFECDADLTLFEDSYKGKIMGSLSPLSVSASASTPFKGFEQMNLDASADYSSNALKSDLTIDVASDNIVTMKTDIDFSKNLKSAILSLTTPLEGLKQTSIRYSMSGDIKNFQSELFASIPFCAPIEASTQLKYNSPSDVSGSISFKSQISGLEELKMSAKNIYSGSTYNSHMEASWSSSKKITIQSVLKDSQRDMSGDITLTTPFDIVKQLNIQSATSVSRKEYTSTFSTSYNGFRYADLGVKVATGNNKQVSITMRSPVTMLIEMSGAKAGDLYEGGLLFSRDITQRSDSFIVDGKVNLVKKEIVLKHKCPMMTFNLDGTFTLPSSKVDFVLNNDRYAYDMQLAANNGHIKLVLPSRSLKISGSKSSNKAEASLMWDADRDETKKVAVRAVITPTSDSLKADVALMLPSIGKDAQIESEVILNRGRILFDGKTELSYSKDSRKRITLMTRLEDISTDRSSQNYSFVLGISHPFTSVDVKLSSHVGRSNDRLTGSVNMDYMTARRETKTFSVNGEVDKVKKSAFFNMITPVKRISIVGNTQKQPFQLSFKNSYDNKAPLTTLLSVDTVRRSVNFEMNYDLANPSSELRISAKYVNSSAVAAEIFHIVSGQKISDALITTRLNNSHLLHSRLHWRPSALQELKEYLSHKASSSMTRGSAALDGINADISKEVSQKTAMISQEIINEMMPLMKISADMYERNDYHYRDVVDAVILAIEAVRIRCEKAHTQALDMIVPLKENLLAAVAMVPDVSIDHYMPDLTYISSVNGRMYNMTRHPSVMSMGNKYSQYVRYMNEIRQNPSFNMADRFTSAIYGARNLVNPVILQQGENAFKYWEVKENSQAVLEAVLDWLKEEIEKELSDIQANIMNLAKTSVTVYDPEHGEIQTEVHLPFPVQALDVVPNFDLTPFVSKVRQYTPRVPRITMPSTDITSWLPPFDAEATLEGNTITTFDGVTYELPDSCTQILARDFVDGNFSIILNKVDNNNKSIIISFDGKVVEILPSGQVKINGKNIESSTELNNIVITLFDDEVSVDGAGSFEVTYSPALDTYTININGWYYGKTAGLLGTYDNEPSNDFLSSFGKPIDSIDRFTKTWDIGTSKCR